MDQDKLVKYEEGLLSEKEATEFFQEIINSGEAWGTDDNFMKSAMYLLESGYCTLGEKSFTDLWGGYIPSISDVEEGGIGTQDYVDRCTEARRINKQEAYN